MIFVCKACILTKTLRELSKQITGVALAKPVGFWPARSLCGLLAYVLYWWLAWHTDSGMALVWLPAYWLDE